MKQVKYSFGGAIDRFRPFFFAAALCLTTSLGAQSPFPDEGMPETDFRPIFDGRTLDGWTYDPVYWRVEEGCIVGEVTPETLLERNSFIIWRGDAPADFELKMEYRVSAEGNSGINYRSSEVPGVPMRCAVISSTSTARANGPDKTTRSGAVPSSRCAGR